MSQQKLSLSLNFDFWRSRFRPAAPEDSGGEHISTGATQAVSPRTKSATNRTLREEIRTVDSAINILQFTNKRAAPILIEMIESALSNIGNSSALSWDTDDLIVSTAFVDEGPTLRRFKPRAQGRATRINKRTSHITLELQPR